MSVIPFRSPMASERPARQAVATPTLSVPGAPGFAVAWPSLWLRRWRDRRALAALDLEQIRDVDLDPFVVRREASKPFWRA